MKDKSIKKKLLILCLTFKKGQLNKNKKNIKKYGIGKVKSSTIQCLLSWNKCSHVCAEIQ